MAGSVNMPGALAIGDLPSTSSVRLGRGGALVVDNSGTGAAGSVSIAGSYSLVNFDFGTSPVSCGAVSCTSVVSAGDVTQPQRSLRLYKTAAQSIGHATATVVLWDTIETAGGGATNWTFVPPTGTIVVPTAGRYFVTFDIAYAAGGGPYHDTWAIVNNGGVLIPGRRWGETVVAPVSGAVSSTSGQFTYQFAANDQLIIGAYQTSGGNLNLLGLAAGQASSISLTWLSV
jgi:hypothetical protein